MRWFRTGGRRWREVENRIGYRFSDPSLLETALTHRSHAHERSDGERTNYERLEFLGDSLLGFLVSEWLYEDDAGAAEGVLTRRRQSVVRASTLARATRRLELGPAIRLGRGEKRTGGHEKPSLLADAYEAVLGAIYLDGGIRPTKRFVERTLGGSLRETRSSTRTSEDYKTHLQERIQAELRRTPRYRIVSTSGPAHALRFEVEVVVGERALAIGRGTNRKRAEQEAARRALEVLGASGD